MTKKICINAGHAPFGLPDPGAVNQENGAREADIVRAIAYMVSSYLEGSGYETKIVQLDSLADICRIANDWEADYFISLHCNSAYTNKATGTETYCYEFGGEGEALAECINNSVCRKMDMWDRGVKEANFYVLRHTNMPAVLCELGFINNAEDCAKLVHRQPYFAEAVYKGIIIFLEG